MGDVPTNGNDGRDASSGPSAASGGAPTQTEPNGQQAGHRIDIFRMAIGFG